jgi:hypothetical protein
VWAEKNAVEGIAHVMAWGGSECDLVKAKNLSNMCGCSEWWETARLFRLSLPILPHCQSSKPRVNEWGGAEAITCGSCYAWNLWSSCLSFPSARIAVVWSHILPLFRFSFFIPKRLWLRLLQRHLHTHVYCGTIHNSQVMETAKMPHHQRMD